MALCLGRRYWLTFHGWMFSGDCLTRTQRRDSRGRPECSRHGDPLLGMARSVEGKTFYQAHGGQESMVAG